MWERWLRGGDSTLVSSNFLPAKGTLVAGRATLNADSGKLPFEGNWVPIANGR